MRAIALLSLLLTGCTWYTSSALRPDGQLYLVGSYGFAGFYVPIVKRCAEQQARMNCEDLDVADGYLAPAFRPGGEQRGSSLDTPQDQLAPRTTDPLPAPTPPAAPELAPRKVAIPGAKP